VPYNGKIVGWKIFSDVAGTCVVDFLTQSYTTYPAGTSIFPGTKPNLSSALKNEATGLNISIAAGDILTCDLVSVSGSMTRIDVTLIITK
jgi:hypothetical protein